MQLILAVNPTDSVKNQIAAQLEDLKKEYPYFRWIDQSDYHLELQIFENKSDVAKLKGQIEEAVYDIEKTRVYTSGADLFMKTGLTLYVTFHRNKMIEKMVAQIRARFHMDEKTKFLPQIVFARYKIPSKQQYLLIKKKLHALTIDVEFDVTQITLFNSVIESEKQFFETVAEIPLQEKLL